MQSNKSPGSDGFSTEFFKVFWKYIGIYVVRSINYGYENNFLSITQRHGVITLLPKGDKPKHFLNKRPTGLNGHLRILISQYQDSHISKHVFCAHVYDLSK